MTFEIFKAFPPDREGPVAELNVRHDGLVDIPAEIRREEGKLRIAIFAQRSGVAWDYPLDEFLVAVQEAVEVLGDE